MPLETIRVSQKLVVGSQPSREEINQLGQQGFKTVINLRVTNEDEGMLLPEDEAEVVKETGMTYLHLPVSMKQLRAEQVDEFCHAVDALEGPAFVHCKLGKRAALFAMLCMAAEQHWRGERTLDEAKKAGFDLDDPLLVDFITEYADRRAEVSR